MSLPQYDTQSRGPFPVRGNRVAPPVLPGLRDTIAGYDDDDWRIDASCRDTDPELFFPAATTGEAIVQIAAAKAVCARCPAKRRCLEFALATNQESGIWGGTSEEERRKVRRSWLARRRTAF